MLLRLRRARPARIESRGAAANGPAPGGRLAGGCLVAGLALLAYSNAFDAPFVFDDLHSIVGNPAIRLASPSVSELARAAFESPLPRPVAYLSFALNYALGGYEVRGYHVVNLAVHVGCALLAWALAGRLLAREPLRRGFPIAPAALFAACLFAVHPVQTQAVTYVVQRMTSLAALFYLASFLLYLVGRDATARARRAWLWSAALACWLLALGTKEIAVTLPLVLFLHEWYFERGLSLAWLRRSAPLAAALALALAAAALLHLGAHPLDRLLAGYADYEFGPRERLLTQARVVVFYLGLLAFPHPSRLNLLHDFAPSRSLVDPASTALSLALLAALAAGAALLARRERLLSFCVAWFFVHQLVESTFVPLEMAYEHRLYLPVFGFALLVADLLFRAAPLRLATALAAALVALLGAWTHARNATWRDAVELWSDVVAKSPESARPRINLGTLLVLEGRHAEAVEQLAQAVRLAPRDANAHNNLGQALTRSGRLAAAKARFAEAVALDPANASARFNLALALEQEGRPEQARPHFAEALRLDPSYARFALEAYQRAAAHARSGRFAAAVEEYGLALRMRPAFPAALRERALALEELGRHEEALSDLREAARLRGEGAAPVAP
jgi:Flp pilus assembly protein TadD